MGIKKLDDIIFRYKHNNEMEFFMEKEKILLKLKKFKDEFQNEIVPHYQKGNDAEGGSHFSRWVEKLGAFVITFSIEKADRLQKIQNTNIYGFSTNESSYSIFMRHKGSEAIAFVDSLIKESFKKVSHNLIYKDPEVETIFIDIVQFSKMPHEERIKKLKNLNSIVIDAFLKINFDEYEGVLVIPTGDGMAISIILQKAVVVVDIASSIREGCEKNDIPVRIGINKSRDTIIRDINNRINLTGPGIIGAQRIMDFATSYEINISESVYQAIKDRVSSNFFSPKMIKKDKHDIEWTYYKYKEHNIKKDKKIKVSKIQRNDFGIYINTRKEDISVGWERYEGNPNSFNIFNDYISIGTGFEDGFRYPSRDTLNAPWKYWAFRISRIGRLSIYAVYNDTNGDEGKLVASTNTSSWGIMGNPFDEFVIPIHPEVIPVNEWKTIIIHVDTLKPLLNKDITRISGFRVRGPINLSHIWCVDQLELIPESFKEEFQHIKYPRG